MTARRTMPQASSTQGGQALTEFIVVLVAVLPLFLLIPLIAKYQDIGSSTQLASRYVAFEATTRNDTAGTWKPEAQLRDEVARRFFSNPDAPIKTADVAGDFKADQNLFWRDPGGEPLIRSLQSDLQLSFGPGQAATHAGAFSASVDGAPFEAHGALDLQARGIYRANVRAKLANAPAGLKFFRPFDAIDLAVARSTSLVPEPWSSTGPLQVESRVAGGALFPASQLSSFNAMVGAAIGAIDAPGGIQGPMLGRLDFWRDVVPQDRLRSGN